MNTDQEYEDYWTAMIAAEKLAYPNPVSFAKKAIKAGLKDFWGASNWYFAQDEYELEITSGAETYNLPTKFAGFITIREETSTPGQRLQFYPKEEFDRIVPKLSTWNNNVPQMFTIYHKAGETNALKLRMFPIPSADQTIYIRMKLRPPDSVDKVPDDFQSGVDAFIAKYIYPHSHRGRLAAYQLSITELRRLQSMDKMDHSNATFFQDSTSRQVYTGAGDVWYWGW